MNINSKRRTATVRAEAESLLIDARRAIAVEREELARELRARAYTLLALLPHYNDEL